MTEVAPVQAAITAPQAASFLTRVWKATVFFWKFLMGMVCCQSLLFSLLLVGWTYRFMQRAALKSWWKRSGSI